MGEAMGDYAHRLIKGLRFVELGTGRRRTSVGWPEADRPYHIGAGRQVDNEGSLAIRNDPGESLPVGRQDVGRSAPEVLGGTMVETPRARGGPFDPSSDSGVNGREASRSGRWASGTPDRQYDEHCCRGQSLPTH